MKKQWSKSLVVQTKTKKGSSGCEPAMRRLRNHPCWSIGQRSACPGRLKIIGTKLLCAIMATLDSSPSAIDHAVHSRCPLLKGMLVRRQTRRTLLRSYSRCFPCRTQCLCTNHPLLMPLSIPRKRSFHRRVILDVSFLRDNCGSELCLARIKGSRVF